MTTKQEIVFYTRWTTLVAFVTHPWFPSPLPASDNRCRLLYRDLAAHVSGRMNWPARKVLPWWLLNALDGNLYQIPKKNMGGAFQKPDYLVYS